MAISKAQMRAVAKYDKAHYKRVITLVTFQQKEDIQAAAEKAGESLSQYMKKAALQRMEREKSRKEGFYDS